MTAVGNTGLLTDVEVADRLGEILVRRGILSRTELDAVLRRQAGGLLPLGSLLLNDGLLDMEALHDALGRQRGLRAAVYRLGELLLAYGLVSDADLAWALERRRGTGKLLGALLVEAGKLAADQLREVLSLQSVLRRRLLAAMMAGRPQDELDRAADGELADRLGEILVRRGVLSRAELQAALESQRGEPLPLGSLLLERGLVDAAALDEALGRQEGLRAAVYRLGDLLLAYGLVSEADLASALEQRRRSGKRLGTLLVEAGKLAADQLREVLLVQARLRWRALAAVAALSVHPLVGEAAQGSAATQQTQVIDVLVHIPDRMNVTEGLSLGLPGTPGIDRIRLLQPLLPYAQTADTRIVTAQSAGGGDFTLEAPGRLPVSVELRLICDPTEAMIELKANLETRVPGGVSANSHLLEMSFDRASFESMAGGDYAGQIQLVIAPI